MASSSSTRFGGAVAGRAARRELPVGEVGEEDPEANNNHQARKISRAPRSTHPVDDKRVRGPHRRGAKSDRLVTWC